MASPSSSDPLSHAPALDAFWRLGGNALHLHGEGGETHSKAAAGKWLRGNALRDEFLLCTQLCHDGWNEEAQAPIVRFNPEGVAEDVDSDLDLLATDRIDLAYLDDNPALPFEPVLDALVREHWNGRVGAIGARNWMPGRLEAAHEYLKGRGGPGFGAVVTTELSFLQPKWPLWPEYIPFDDSLSAVVAKLHLAVFAHVGDLTLGQSLFGDADPIASFRQEWVQRWQSNENVALADRIRELAIATGMTTREVSIAWALKRNHPTIGIVGLPDFLTDRTEQLVRACQVARSPL